MLQLSPYVIALLLRLLRHVMQLLLGVRDDRKFARNSS